MNFKPIGPLDFSDLKSFVQNQQYRLCFYSLPSILTWSNEFYQHYGAIDSDTLFISVEYPKQPEKRYLLLPLSPVKDFPPEALRDLAVTLGFEKFSYVSEEYLAQYGRNQIKPFFNICEQKGFEDYIYLTEDLLELKGNKFSKKRNLIKQFQREYVDKNQVRVEPITPSITGECLEFMREWCREINLDMDKDEELICEKEAILKNIEHIGLLETPGMLLRVNGELCAFAISTHLTDDMAVLPYEKAYAKIKGLYQYFDNLCAKELFKGYKYINKESDMNVPGIAKAKISYHPILRVKSYELQIRK